MCTCVIYVYRIHAGSQRGQKRSHQIRYPGTGVIVISHCARLVRVLSTKPSLQSHVAFSFMNCCYFDYITGNASKTLDICSLPHCTSSSHLEGRPSILHLFNALFILYYLFKDNISLCDPSWPRTCYVD